MDSTKFGWPCKLKKNWLFWTTKVNYHGFEIIVNRIKNMKDKEFKTLFLKYAQCLMIYYKNNKILKSEIKKLKIFPNKNLS